MSANPKFNELTQAIEDNNLALVKKLLTITVTKTLEEEGWTEEYQTQILSLQAFELDLTVTEIKALHQLVPELLQNRINMEMAMLRAIEAEDLDFIQAVLNICADNQGNYETRCPSFVKIIKKAISSGNDAIITAILACPHPDVAIVSRFRASEKLYAMMNSRLAEENGLQQHAKWFLYQLPFLLTNHDYQKIAPEQRIKIIQDPGIQAELTAAYWQHSEYLLSITTNISLLNALLENPKLFSQTLNLLLRVSNREHQNWRALANEKALIFLQLKTKINEKMANIANAHLEDIKNYYRPLLDYYLELKAKNSNEIQQLLSLEALQQQIIKNFSTYQTFIFAGHAQYRELLHNATLLKYFFDSAFASLEEELGRMNLECPRIKTILTAYQDKTDAPDIWGKLNQELPELKKDLVRLDQGLPNFPELKQLLKNLLHLVASLLTLGVYYYQRQRDLGQCFFKSPILEQQVRLQQTHLQFTPVF